MNQNEAAAAIAEALIEGIPVGSRFHEDVERDPSKHNRIWVYFEDDLEPFEIVVRRVRGPFGPEAGVR